MTGIFLDQKEVRKKLKEHYSDNRNILNVFSYTTKPPVISASLKRIFSKIEV